MIKQSIDTCICFANFRWHVRTSTPGDIVSVDLVQDARCLFLRVDGLDAAHEHLQFAGEAGAELLDRRDLLFFADDAGYGPGALEEDGGEELGDFAMAA